eukprot:8308741-Alexandrium_andersonii.AAC.1
MAVAGRARGDGALALSALWLQKLATSQRWEVVEVDVPDVLGAPEEVRGRGVHFVARGNEVAHVKRHPSLEPRSECAE